MLTYAYCPVTRTLFACMDLDTKSCYNRIMALFGMLCSRCFRMPKAACILHRTTISEMKHHVKRALGLLSSFFQSSCCKYVHLGTQIGKTDVLPFSSSTPESVLVVSLIKPPFSSCGLHHKSCFLVPVDACVVCVVSLTDFVLLFCLICVHHSFKTIQVNPT
jgi:hypothetical protein